MLKCASIRVTLGQLKPIYPSPFGQSRLVVHGHEPISTLVGVHISSQLDLYCPLAKVPHVWLWGTLPISTPKSLPRFKEVEFLLIMCEVVSPETAVCHTQLADADALEYGWLL